MTSIRVIASRSICEKLAPIIATRPLETPPTNNVGTPRFRAQSSRTGMPRYAIM
ncbi:MAG: hypothetical protein KDN05_13370 [Verrucomicrobiae bacterium]|nr:hypothetical protein [Verrucomicrobiae bacterium]